MNYRRKILYVTLLLVVALSSTACSKTLGTKTETPYYSLTIDGGKNYRSENDETVQKLIEVTTGYIDASVPSNYEDINVQRELDYYTSATRAEYEASDYENDLSNMLKAYELKTEVVDKNVVEMKFYSQNQVECASVSYEYTTSVKHATAEYLEILELELDTVYKRVMTISYTMEDGSWKISDYTVTEREKVQ